MAQARCMTGTGMGGWRVAALVAGAAVLALSGCGNAGAGGAATTPTPASGTQHATPASGATPTQGGATGGATGGAVEGKGMGTGGTESTKPKTELAMFGAGCFWGVEHIFKDQPGVLDAVSGYSGGRTSNPTYQEVCEGNTGHVEVVQLTFDPSQTSYEQLVTIFFRLHDPTQVNRQGPDIGEQYRSVIYFYNDEQKQVAEAVKARRAPMYKKPIATTIEPARTFYKAEDYHQDYYVRTGKQPYCHFLRPE